jgi:hypothetical protein
MARLGVGLNLSRKCYTAQRVTRQLESLAAPSFHERAREIGNRISAEKGLPGACEAIETAIQSA